MWIIPQSHRLAMANAKCSQEVIMHYSTFPEHKTRTCYTVARYKQLELLSIASPHGVPIERSIAGKSVISLLVLKKPKKSVQMLFPLSFRLPQWSLLLLMLCQGKLNTFN